MWRRQNRTIGSSHDHFRQSVQYLRNGSGHVRRIGSQNLWLFRTYREICCVVIPTELTTTNKSLRAECFTTLDDRELDKSGRLMSRVFVISRQRSIQSKRMDPWEHEDRSSIGGGSQSSSRPLRNRDHDRILI